MHHVELIGGRLYIISVENGWKMLSLYCQKLGVAPLTFQMFDIHCVQNEFAEIALLSKGKYLIM